MGLVIRSLWLKELNLSKLSKEHTPSRFLVSAYPCFCLNTGCASSFVDFLCHSTLSLILTWKYVKSGAQSNSVTNLDPGSLNKNLSKPSRQGWEVVNNQSCHQLQWLTSILTLSPGDILYSRGHQPPTLPLDKVRQHIKHSVHKSPVWDVLLSVSPTGTGERQNI